MRSKHIKSSSKLLNPRDSWGRVDRGYFIMKILIIGAILFFAFIQVVKVGFKLGGALFRLAVVFDAMACVFSLATKLASILFTLFIICFVVCVVL